MGQGGAEWGGRLSVVGRGRLFLEVGEGGGGGRLFPLLPLFPSPHLPPSPPSLPGVLLLVFCRSELAQHVGEVSTASVACGVMGVGGNKGAVRGQGGAEGPAHTPAKPYFIALYAAALYTETIHLVIYRGICLSA